jgi:UDP-N-acetylmuramate dehydrogenase
MNIQKNVVLAPYTTYKIGGPADLFIEVATWSELLDALNYAQNENIPYFVLGTGANILISDKGFRGLVIKNSYKTISLEDSLLTVGSGALVKDVIEFTKNLGYSGFEHFAGIPSTIGGALWQNLHFLNPERTGTAYIESIVLEAHTWNKLTGQENILKKEDFQFGYDTSVLHQGNDVVIDATFTLTKLDKEIIEDRIQKNLAWRSERHPPVDTEPSCGSVFKKLEYKGETIAAAKLMDEAGLKGYRSGDVIVSLKHPNFLTHTGKGTAADVLTIIKHVQEVVYEKFGVLLETEIGLIGEF